MSVVPQCGLDMGTLAAIGHLTGTLTVLGGSKFLMSSWVIFPVLVPWKKVMCCVRARQWRVPMSTSLGLFGLRLT